MNKSNKDYGKIFSKIKVHHAYSTHLSTEHLQHPTSTGSEYTKL